jgi:hypothetical protein
VLEGVPLTLVVPESVLVPVPDEVAVTEADDVPLGDGVTNAVLVPDSVPLLVLV